jgi:hypothetical protein
MVKASPLQSEGETKGSVVLLDAKVPQHESEAKRAIHNESFWKGNCGTESSSGTFFCGHPSASKPVRILKIKPVEPAAPSRRA